MSLLEFFFSFFILCFAGSGACIGWYTVTRGHYEVTPEGKWVVRGMLFKHWQFFFEQYRTMKKVYFRGDGLQNKFYFLKKVHPKIMEKTQFDLSRIWTHSGNTLSDAEVNLLRDAAMCDIEVEENGMLVLSVQEPVYLFPEWIQKPFSSCPVCYSGPYGTAIWLLFLKLQRDAFVWTDSPLLAYIYFGLIFLLTLSSFNKFVTRKLNL